MQVPQWVARANRHITNPVLGLISPWAPLFGTIKHTGRKSGKPYSTPVTLFKVPEGVLVILTYGPNRDWLKNLAAAGGGEAVHRGKTHRVAAPVVKPAAEARLPRLFTAFISPNGHVAVLPKA